MQKNKFNEFRHLHENDEPLLLVNIWDAGGAALVQDSGARALATSSASLAWANGYADGCDLPLDILMASIKSILRVSRVPLTVDIENGYSNSGAEVATLVTKLVELGVSGINIEDGDGDPDLLVEKISAIKGRFMEDEIFINARSDTYLRELAAPVNRLKECTRRLEKYIAAGADGVFVPSLNSLADITELSNSINVPLNIMVSSSTNDLEEFLKAGVGRFSMGPDTFIQAYSKLLEAPINQYEADNHKRLTYDMLNELFLNLE